MPNSRLAPHDLAVALRLSLGKALYQRLSDDLALSLSQVHASTRRLARSGLVRSQSLEVNRLALGEFLIHGARYAFPAVPGNTARGIPTAHSAPALAGEIDASEAFVWSSAEGDVVGTAIEPLYPSAPKTRERSPETYHLLTLFDALRVGAARERNLARQKLEAALKTTNFAA